MSKRTSLDLVTEVKEALGNPPAITTTRILGWVWDAANYYIAKYRLPQYRKTETLTTVAGTEEYTLAGTDILTILRIWNSSIGPLGEEDEYDYNSDVHSTGDSTNWFESGVTDAGLVKVTLIPTPTATATYTVTYLREHHDLVLSPTPNYLSLNRVWENPVMNRAISKGWTVLEQEDKAGTFLKLSLIEAEDAYRATARSTDTESHMQSHLGYVVSRFER